ncbi:hypothetical protein [Brachybacterium sp.]|uniref:hypothetical protein n=1 Tax=Brachybacterium sp. TaxID=1891286 RepID=UPI002ED3A877
MADTTTQDAQQAQEQATEAEVEQTSTEATENTQEAAQDDQGKGSKSAVLADLATERDKRQAAETLAQENDAKLTAVLTALGLKTDSTDEVDPAQLATDLKAKDAELAVLRAGNGIADVDALLDSRAFTNTLGTIDPSDRDAVKAHIAEYVTANPRFAVATQKAQGVRDAAAGTERQSAHEGDWIRNAARKN